ncbi:hypothetical protein [Paraburkholderia sp. J12]|uniref:hypothetical protein n=1 Tax=Paraburkholderia sp. J12 TaxID=2805432 RepID=UPI002ABD8482|nr:hypothetical protein [Paraburkholderia sp. J12]
MRRYRPGRAPAPTIALTVVLTSCVSAAWAGQPAAAAPAQQVASVAPPGAAADKVYPPLPTLAMLPPAASDDDDLTPAAPHSSNARKKKLRRPDCHCSAPSPHLVVSDESRAYLQDIEHQLDVALAR